MLDLGRLGSVRSYNDTVFGLPLLNFVSKKNNKQGTRKNLALAKENSSDIWTSLVRSDLEISFWQFHFMDVSQDLYPVT